MEIPRIEQNRNIYMQWYNQMRPKLNRLNQVMSEYILAKNRIELNIIEQNRIEQFAYHSLYHTLKDMDH